MKLVRNATSEREVLLDILHGGECFGTLTVFGGRVYTETAIAQTDCCILQISSVDFEAILSEYPDVTRKVLEVVSQRLAESQEMFEAMEAAAHAAKHAVHIRQG